MEVTKRRWRILGHVLRMPREESITVPLHSPGQLRAKGKSVTPKQPGPVLWRKAERAMAGWKSWEEARALAKDRNNWKKSSAALRATGCEEDRLGESVDEKTFDAFSERKNAVYKFLRRSVDCRLSYYFSRDATYLKFDR